MAKKAVVISEDQLLITDKGEVIKAKDLLSTRERLLSYNNGYDSLEVKNVKKVDSKLVTIYGAQGRTIKCGINTLFAGSEEAIEAPITYKENKIAKVFRYHPVFGTTSISKISLDYLSASLSNLQDKRPNPYTKQTIPLFISKLNSNNLKYLINYMFRYGTLKHLDQQSKDLIIILLSKLGIYFDGQPKQHSSNITGTIKIKDSRNKVNYKETKLESIGLLNNCKDKALELLFDKPSSPIIGSFICQTS